MQSYGSSDKGDMTPYIGPHFNLGLFWSNSLFTPTFVCVVRVGFCNWVIEQDVCGVQAVRTESCCEEG